VERASWQIVLPAEAEYQWKRVSDPGMIPYPRSTDALGTGLGLLRKEVDTAVPIKTPLESAGWVRFLSEKE
jgi:hypothetical protein